MNRSVPWYALSLLMIGLITPTIHASVLPIVTSCSSQAEGQVHVADCDTIDGAAVQVRIIAGQDHHGGIVSLTMTSDSTVLARMTVSVGKSTLRVEGRSGETPFKWMVVSNADGTWTSTHEWGDCRLVAIIEDGASGRGETVLEGVEEDFFQAVHTSRDWQALLVLVEAAERLGDDALLHELPPLVVAGLARDPHVMRSPIGDWLDCLKDTCAACNGCWDGGCGPCNGDPWWAAAAIYACYSLGADLCIPQGIFDLIAGTIGDPERLP